MKAPTYRFGDICVDVERVAVTRAGEPVGLEPKAFDVLRALLEHRDRLVTKDELLNAVWPDTFVTPNVLTRAIAQLRKALGDDAVEAKYIQTVTKRGYRFIAPVTVDADAAAGIGAQQPPSHGERDASGGPQQREADAHTPTVPATGPSSRRFWSTRLVVGVVVVAALSLTTGVWMTRTAGGKASGTSTEPIQTRRLTLRAGNNAEPALSPDGAMVAFSADTTGAFEIYVAGVTLGSREIALTRDGGQNIEPAWSPDGRWIAFHSRARGGIWLVPATGGSPTQIVDLGSAPDWSPDSEWIVFTSSQGAMATQSHLRVVRRDGSGLRDLTRVGTPLGGQRQPRWSRSGRFVAFTVSNGGSSNRVWVVEAEGGTPRELPSVGWTGFIAFGPDDRMLYLTGRSPDRLAIYGLPLNPSTLTPAGQPGVLKEFTIGSMAGLSVSRTNTVAYAVRTTDANLWAVDNPTASSPGEPVPFTRNAIRASGPSFSPDGSQLAFTQAGAGVPRSVWLANADGSSQSPLLTDGEAVSPSWNGNDRLLVFRGATPQVGSLWFVDSRTKRATKLEHIDARGIYNPRLSPNGDSIAYWKLEPGGALNTWVQPVKGGPAQRVTADPEGANYPVWSPDGRWLAVELKRGEETSIGIVSRDGGPIERLTNEHGQSWPHSWVGDSIFFAGERDGVWNVFTVSRRTRAIRQVTHFISPSGRVNYPAASPDGRRVVFERTIDEGGIWTFAAPDSERDPGD